jgi:DNA polymerase I-like protein with 3'-5' exonuclease and polymerase domains
MLEQIPLRQQDEVMKCDHRLQYLCAGMHRVGMYVDQEVRAQNEKVYVQKREDHLKQIHEIAGRVLNPGSTQQLRKLLFSEWKLEPNLEDKFRFTKNGDPSTSDVVIRACLTIPTLEDHQRKLLEQVRYYRKAQKVLGTYIAKIRPSTELAFGWDDDEEYHEQLYRERTGQQKRGITDPRTGRMHPGYNAHVTTTGRLSSSKPINAQNFPGKLRGMVRAAPGHMLVGADADQLELRIAAARWKSIKFF